MDYQLRGKTAYVSAGAHGIGEAIADLLASEGAAVLVSDHDGDVLREKAHKWDGTITADLATADGVHHAIALVLSTFGRAPDIVINNLGVGDSTPFEDITDERWAQIVRRQPDGHGAHLPGAAAAHGGAAAPAPSSTPAPISPSSPSPGSSTTGRARRRCST